MARKTAIILAVLAVIVPFLYDRIIAAWPLYGNRPGALKEINEFKSVEVKFRDRIRNCEDVIIDEGMGLAFLSCDAGRDRWNTVMGTFARDKGLVKGRLYLYDYAHPDLPDSSTLSPIAFENFPNAKDFHPLGLEFDSATSTLYVINHATSGSFIEIFKLSVRSATATHVRTLKQPLLHAPNSIHSLGDGKLFVTNDHYIRAAVSPLLSKVETFAGFATGSVVYVDTKDPDQTAKIVARVPFANGIAMLNTTRLAVASSSKMGVYFYDVNTEDYSLQYKSRVRTPAGADNISVDRDGKLMIAGHPYLFSLIGVAKRRPGCDAESKDEEAKEACRCDAPSWAAEWSEEGGLRELYKGYAICSSSTVVRDVGRGIGMISGLYDRGLLVFKV